MPPLTFRAIRHGGVEYAAAVDLRRRVLRLPLGLDYSPQDLAGEVNDWHLVGVDPQTAETVGVLVLARVTGEQVKMRQVAVEESRRGHGVGRSLVQFAESFAAEQGFAKMTLHARDVAVAFYQRLGYAAEGEPFVEVSIVHRRMCKDLAR